MTIGSKIANTGAAIAAVVLLIASVLLAYRLFSALFTELDKEGVVIAIGLLSCIAMIGGGFILDKMGI
jgi:divalent metal cation (Fe/Co/Zn/Cd) transporter